MATTPKQKTKEKKFQDGSEVLVVVFGGEGGGKSALTIRLVQGNFVEDYDPTIEDSYRKNAKIDGCTYYLDILDTACVDIEEEYASMSEGYLYGGQVFFLVFSITDQRTFDVLPSRIKQIQCAKDAKFFDGILIGNKSDLEDQRQVSRQKAMELAEKHQIPYMETSAKTGDFVEESFYNLVRFANGETIIPQQFSNNIKKAR